MQRRTNWVNIVAIVAWWLQYYGGGRCPVSMDSFILSFSDPCKGSLHSSAHSTFPKDMIHFLRAYYPHLLSTWTVCAYSLADTATASASLLIQFLHGGCTNRMRHFIYINSLWLNSTLLISHTQQQQFTTQFTMGPKKRQEIAFNSQFMNGKLRRTLPTDT